PALVTAVLYRDERHAYGAFTQEAAYLYAAAQPASRWWDLGSRTLECTKRAMALEVWTTLRAHGEGLLGEIVDRQRALTLAFADRLRAATDFELALEPESNIICYRHRPAGAVD